MIVYKNYVIAEPGYYLKSGIGKGIKLPYSNEYTYVEEKLEDNKIKKDKHGYGDNLYTVGKYFMFLLDSNTKNTLVGSLFSVDEQIAIILNKDDSEEDFKVFEFMQGWRKYFSELISKMKALQ